MSRLRIPDCNLCRLLAPSIELFQISSYDANDLRSISFIMIDILFRGGELGVLRVREHPLNLEMHPLTAKSTPQNERKLNETPFQTDIHQSYGGFDVHIRIRTAIIHHFALN